MTDSEEEDRWISLGHALRELSEILAGWCHHKQPDDLDDLDDLPVYEKGSQQP